jgi:hypothetical protein
MTLNPAMVNSRWGSGRLANRRIRQPIGSKPMLANSSRNSLVTLVRLPMVSRPSTVSQLRAISRLGNRSISK